MYSQEVQANQPLHLVVIIYIVDHPKKTSLKHLTWSIFGREPLTHLQKLLQHEVDKPYIYPRCSMYGLFTYIWVVLGINVGKYTSSIEHLGIMCLYNSSLRPHISHWATGPMNLERPTSWPGASGMRDTPPSQRTKEKRVKVAKKTTTTVDGRNLANQLRLVVYPILSKVWYIPSGAGFLPSTVVSYKVLWNDSTYRGERTAVKPSHV